MADEFNTIKVRPIAGYKECTESSTMTEVSLQQHPEIQQFTKLLNKLSKNIDQEFNSIRKEQTKFRKEVKRDMAGMKTKVHTFIQKANDIQTICKKSRGHVTFCPVASAQGLISESDEIPEICLKEGLEDLVEDLDLVTTQVLAEMVAEKCLTEEEEKSIRKQKDRKNQVRKFVVLLSKRSKTHFDTFIKIIQRPQKYPKLAKMLSENCQKQKQSRQNPKCLRCSIQNKVDICDVVDKLCHYNIVDLKFLDKCTENNSTNSLWGELFDIINNTSESPNPIDIFREALEVKYDNLAKKVETGKQFICNCETVGETTHQYDSDAGQSISSESCSARSTSHENDSRPSSQIYSSDDDAVNTFSQENLAEKDDTQGFNDTQSDAACRMSSQNKLEKKIRSEADDNYTAQNRMSTDGTQKRSAPGNYQEASCVKHKSESTLPSHLDNQQEGKFPMHGSKTKLRTVCNACPNDTLHQRSLGSNDSDIVNREDTGHDTAQETSLSASLHSSKNRQYEEATKTDEARKMDTTKERAEPDVSYSLEIATARKVPLLRQDKNQVDRASEIGQTLPGLPRDVAVIKRSKVSRNEAIRMQSIRNSCIF